jgi:hypothetical protein
MEDIARDVGLLWAGTFPGALALTLGALVLTAWLAVKAENLEASSRGPVRFGLAIVAIIIVAQGPAAYSRAKSDCRREYQQAGGSSNTLGSAPVTYAFSKCAKVWPNGPDNP